MEPVIFCISL